MYQIFRLIFLMYFIPWGFLDRLQGSIRWSLSLTTLTSSMISPWKKSPFLSDRKLKIALEYVYQKQENIYMFVISNWDRSNLAVCRASIRIWTGGSKVRIPFRAKGCRVKQYGLGHVIYILVPMSSTYPGTRKTLIFLNNLSENVTLKKFILSLALV